MTKLPSKPLVIVKWEDPHSPAGTICIDDNSIDELHKTIPMHTVGWLLKDDAKGVSIGGEWCGDGDYRSTTFIPRSLIHTVHKLNRAKKILAEPSESFDGGLTASVV